MEKLWVPFADCTPPQSPLAVQVVAFVDDQENVPPRISRVGATGATLTVTGTSTVTSPPGPVQVMEYVVVSEGVMITPSLFWIALLVEKFVPTQAVELVEFQTKEEESPEKIDDGIARIETVGIGAKVAVIV
jgi:hypothetical protein